MPIHDQGYRRYAGGSVRLAGRGPSSPGRPAHVPGQARVPRAPAAVVAAVHRARGPDLRGGNFPQVSFLAPTPRHLPAVPRAAGHLRVLRDGLRRRGPHRQRSPRERAADLSVEAAHPRRVRLRQAGDSDDLPAAGHVAAGDPAALIVQVAFAGSFTFFLNNLFLLPAITAFSFLVAIVAAATMLALSSLSNNSRYVGICTPR